MGTSMKFRIASSALLLLAGFAGFATAAGISTHTFNSCNLPDTGLTGDYTATFGEDPDYRPSGSQLSYTIYSPGGISSVTVDNRTGLMWVTNPVDAGISGTYTWESALTTCETGIGGGGSYAGYTDWRLPNIRELTSIMNYSGGNPAINTVYFLNTQSEAYWSSTTAVQATTNAWYSDFSNIGNLSYLLKTAALRIRCVRGGP